MDKIIRIRQTKQEILSWLGAGLSVVFFATHTSAQTQAATPACIQITVSSVVETPTVPPAKPSSVEQGTQEKPSPVLYQSNRAAAFGSAVNLTASGFLAVVASNSSAGNGATQTANDPFSLATKDLAPYYQRMPVTGNSIMSPDPGWSNAGRMAVSVSESNSGNRLGSQLKTHFTHK